MDTFPFTLEDFTGAEPYKYLWNIKETGSDFLYESTKEEMAAFAKKLGFSRFKTMLRAFEAEEVKQKKRLRKVLNEGLVTQFHGQQLELSCGDWEATDMGIFRTTITGGRECACAHPILPVERMVNIDSGEVKIRLAFSRGGKWQTVVVDKETISSARSITSLSKFGISVTSNSAKVLVDYLNDVENLNFDQLAERRSVSRCGYIAGHGFSPYGDDLVFDGDSNFRHIFNAIRPNGNEFVWKDIARRCRKMSTTARIILSASFASILLEPLGALPFFVHLWGSDSGTGKTVALMLAASAWGNPALGEYISSFNATTVGCEYTAAFLNHLPLCLDELQLAKDDRGRAKFDVYQLAQGLGRTRGSKGGGLAQVPTWRNCILTTGESPLINAGAGAGAINRVIDIECKADSVVISDGMAVAASLRANYGFSGQTFVDAVYSDAKTDDGLTMIDLLKDSYDDIFKQLSASNTTEKQAMAAAVIAVADRWLTNIYLKDDLPPLEDILVDFLAEKEDVSVGARAYSYLRNWIATNSNKLRETENGETYGRIDGAYTFIIRSAFNKALADGGFSPAPVLSYLKSKGLLDCRSGKGFTKTKRIGGVPTDCIVLDIAGDGGDDDELPF